MRIISVLDEFIRKEKFTNPIKSEELRNELFLDFDNFNQPKIKKDNYALAQLILNLLLTEPGTYPDTPELGINIAQYQFEFLNSNITSKIQNKIEKQVDLYIPSNNIQKIIVLVNNNGITNKKELIIGFSVGSINDNGAVVSDNFFIRVANDEINGTRTQILENF